MAIKTSKLTVCTDFRQFSAPVAERFKEMSKRELYVTSAQDNVFGTYLAAFPEGTNPLHKERTQHDCRTCYQFIRRLGSLVNIVDGRIVTLWEGLELPYPYSAVAEKLHELVSAAKIESVFRTEEAQYGVDHNYSSTTNERFDHFHGKIASRHKSDSPGTAIGSKASLFGVFRRGLTEFQIGHFEDVLDLIENNGIYRGEEHKPAVQGFLEMLRKFKALKDDPDLFAWENLDFKYAGFRNTAIGTLFVDLVEGKDLENAVKAFEVKVAPTNYKRPTAVITQAMVEKAVQTMTDLGLHGAIARRYARLSDVSVNDVLFVDNESKGKMKDGISALLEADVAKPAPSMKQAVPITADKFVSEVLPTAKTVEVYAESKHLGNFVSLTGADGPERPFKWNNNFAWSYDGDVTDSVKQRVKAAGGNVNALLRVSLSWFNLDDLDLHVLLPGGNHVYFGCKQGILDVDMNACRGTTRTPVENLAFNRLIDGEYRIFVNQYCQRETTDVGFAIEVEFGGEIRQFSYPTVVRQGHNVQCFTLHVKNGQLERIESDLSSTLLSQEKWGVKTQTMVPVNAIMYSPNHWGNNAVGAKHLIFALKNCKNPDKARGFYNEFLRSDLEEHRKVFEILGARTKCAPSDDQISGLGFTAARGDAVTVVVNGRRAYVVTF